MLGLVKPQRVPRVREGSAFLAFGVSVVPIGLLSTEVSRVSVTHHATLPASTAVLTKVAAVISATETVTVGVSFGVVGALLGVLAQRVLYAYADTHLGPLAASIMLTSGPIAVLASVGLLPTATWIPGLDSLYIEEDAPPCGGRTSGPTLGP